MTSLPKSGQIIGWPPPAVRRLSALVLVLLANQANFFAESDPNATTLPELWSAIGEGKSYHITYKIQMRDSNERTMVEEWGSFERKLFRLDLLSSKSTLSEGRVTFLSNGNTEEVFCYKPFVCSQLEANSQELNTLRTLFLGYPISGDSNSSFLAYGLGPLWLRAMGDEAKVSYYRVDGSFEYNYNFANYDAYFVKLEPKVAPGGQQPGGKPAKPVGLAMRFLFRPYQNKFIDIIDWLDARQEVTETRQEAIAVRLKVLDTDFDPIPDEVFNLPAGFGCRRAPKFEHPFNLGLGKKVLSEVYPNQATVDVILSRPRDELLRLWSSEKFSLNLVRGSFKLKPKADNYWIVSSQWRDSLSGRLNRKRLIWFARAESEQALVYEIDTTSGRCSIGHRSVENSIQIEFPDFSDGDSAIAKATGVPSISLDLIIHLFNDDGNYHLIRDSETSRGETLRFSQAIYEKRELNFTSNGWPGPVSILKEIHYIQYSSSPISYHTTISVLFLSQDLKHILYKAVIDLAKQEMVDVRYFHRQLNVGQCFSDNAKSGSLDIVLKYPIESAQLNEKLYSIQDLLELKLLRNLFRTTPIIPLQVNNVQLQFSQFYLSFKMTLLDLPLTQSFNYKPNLRLAGEGGSKIIEQRTASVERCAIACDHYNCASFSYGPKRRLCSIELRAPNSTGRPAELVAETGASLYERPKREGDTFWTRYEQTAGGRSHLRPRQIVDLLGAFVGSNAADKGPAKDEEADPTAGYEPLVIRIENTVLPEYSLTDSSSIELRPLSIESDFESIDEYLKRSSDSGPPEEDVGGLKAYYNLLAEGRKFPDSPENLISGVSYDQCAQHCENSNCRSFSYCDSDKVCKATDLHGSQDIMAKSTPDDRCNVFSLDYLSKFESFGRVKRPISVRKLIKQADSRECARACMEETDFNCHAFYQCDADQPELATGNCLLKDKHIDDKLGTSGGNKAAPIDGELANVNGNGTLKCRLYSRSYLAQFNEFLGKSIELPQSVSSELIENVGSESCAKLCIEKSCSAFSVCLNLDRSQTNSEFPVSRLSCSMAREAIRRDFIKPNKDCVTFVLSEKSQFNTRGAKEINSPEIKPDRPAQVDLEPQQVEQVVVADGSDQEALTDDLLGQFFNFLGASDNSNGPNQVDESHWLSKLISLVFGLILGACLMALWASRDGIYLTVSGFADQYRNRR